MSGARVLLLRHGTAHSEEEYPGRPLNDDGEREAMNTARAFANYITAKGGDPPDLILVHSGKMRAAMTCEPFLEYMTASKLIGHGPDMEALSPDSDPKVAVGLMDELRTPENTLLVLVGHLPHLHKLAVTLLGEEAAAAAGVSAESFTPAGGLLLENRQGSWVLCAKVPDGL